MKNNEKYNKSKIKDCNYYIKQIYSITKNNIKGLKRGDGRVADGSCCFFVSVWLLERVDAMLMIKAFDAKRVFFGAVRRAHKKL